MQLLGLALGLGLRLCSETGIGTGALLGKSWQLLEAPGNSWQLLPAPGSSWQLLVAPWAAPGTTPGQLPAQLLAAPGSSWRLLAAIWASEGHSEM